MEVSNDSFWHLEPFVKNMSLILVINVVLNLMC